MDTVTLLRSAIRGLLAAAGEREPALRAVLRRDDDYRTGGKPAADWDDAAARAALVDALARDGEAVLAALEGEPLPAPLAEAATLLATVLGQDLEDGPRRPDPDRPAGRPRPGHQHGRSRGPPRPQDRGPRLRRLQGPRRARPRHRARHRDRRHAGQRGRRRGGPGAARGRARAPTTAGRSAGRLRRLGVRDGPAARDARGRGCRRAGSRSSRPSRLGGRFTKDDFTIDLAAGTVTCPAGGSPRSAAAPGTVTAEFGRACAACPLAARCTTLADGRKIAIGPHEAASRAAAPRSRDPAWLADYRATRPKVERKIAHLMRRRHGGRRARVRGRLKVGADFSLLAAAVNLARLAVLGLTGSSGTWATRTG